MSEDTARVLVVDDDDDIRETLAEILETAGYRVSTAANGLDAILQLRRNGATGLILLDLMMPIMNGWEFRALQAADPRLALIQVVVISADGRVGEKAAPLRPAASLVKPVPIGELLDVIDRNILAPSGAGGGATSPARSNT